MIVDNVTAHRKIKDDIRNKYGEKKRKKKKHERKIAFQVSISGMNYTKKKIKWNENTPWNLFLNETKTIKNQKISLLCLSAMATNITPETSIIHLIRASQPCRATALKCIFVLIYL